MEQNNAEFLQDCSSCLKYINSWLHKHLNLNENYDIESLIDVRGLFLLLIISLI